MTQYQVTVDGDVVQPVLQRDDGLAQLVSAVLDQILEAQVTEQLQAERFERIQELATQGMSKSAIAHALGVHRHTVQNYPVLETPPERPNLTRKTSILTPYVKDIVERWHHGCRNAMQLWREIVAHGYPGSNRNVACLTGELRRHERRGEPWPQAPLGLTLTKAVSILVRRATDRATEDQRTIGHLPAVHPELRQAIDRFEAFARLRRDRPVEDAGQRLEQCMASTVATEIPELTAVVTKLCQDAEAVIAALQLPYSRGQAEWRFNRLIRINRSMSGQAGSDLLQQRFVYAPIH